MPLILLSALAMTNIYPTSLTSQQYKDAKDAIDALQYADLFASPGTLRNPAGSHVRVDMQGTFNRSGAIWSNIQAQMNGVRGHSTVACAEVNRTSVNAGDNEANQRGALHKVQEALKKSLYGKLIYTVTGDIP